MTDDEFASIFEAHRDAVYRFAWRKSGPASAEDIAQDVFLALLRQPQRFDPGRGTMRAFLLGIARNVALKRWRDDHRWAPLDDEDDVALPSVELDGLGTGERVAAAVRSLPPLQREALILAEYEELSLEEIAKAVQAEVGTVKSRLHRARSRLRRVLTPLLTGERVRRGGSSASAKATADSPKLQR